MILFSFKLYLSNSITTYLARGSAEKRDLESDGINSTDPDERDYKQIKVEKKLVASGPGKVERYLPPSPFFMI